MKWLISNNIIALLLIFLFLSTTSINAQDIKTDTVYIVDTVYLDKKDYTEYDKKIKRIESKWRKLIPRYHKAQFAGSMGLISIGTGWDYGKNKQWETDLLFGFVPKYSTQRNKMTMTLKQNYIPWTVRLNDRFNLKPLSTGLYLNTIFGSDFWGRQPTKYPNGYYGFSPKVRFNVFVGQGWEYKFDTSKTAFCKSITFFYEVSTNELYLISAITNHSIKAKDFLGLSLGIKLQFL